MVSIHKFQVYKVISRPRIDESLKWNLVKIILTKNQEKNKKDKERVRIRKSRYIELDKTYCYIEKFNAVLSLYGVLKVTHYFFKSFSEVVVEGIEALEVP